MNRSFFIIAAFGALFVLIAACTTKEEPEEIFCESILDCPDGMDCIDYVCVEMTADTTPADKDTAVPDQSDQSEGSDPSDDIDAIDTEPADDQPVIDEDTILPDDTTDELLPDDDELIPDEDELTNEIDELPDLSEVEGPDQAADELPSDGDELLGDGDELLSDDDTVTPESVTIGTGTDTQWIPIGCRYFKYSRSAALYTAAEIGYSATITKLAWYDATGATTSRPVKVYLKDTPEGALSAMSWATAISGATQVYAADITSAFGWNEFTLATPFAHSGSSNLLVLVEMNKGEFTSDEPAFRYTDTTAMHQSWQADSIPTGNGSVDGSRPNITISF